MTQFWRLFVSSYVQEFIDSVSIPTSEQLVEMFIGSDFDQVLNNHKKEAMALFEKIPSVQEFFTILKESAVDQLKKNA